MSMNQPLGCAPISESGLCNEKIAVVHRGKAIIIMKYHHLSHDVVTLGGGSQPEQ